MHNACMTSITIRDVPEETRDELAARAARSGRSLQEYLRASLIDFASRPDVEVLVERVRWHKSMTGSTLPAHEILALKAEDRR